MNKKIIIPYDINTKLMGEFRVFLPTIERRPLGVTSPKSEVKQNTIRQRALQLDGAYVYEQ